MLRTSILSIVTITMLLAHPASAQSFKYNWRMNDSEVLASSRGILTDNGYDSPFRFTGDDQWLGRLWRITIAHTGNGNVSMRSAGDGGCAAFIRTLGSVPGWQRSQDTERGYVSYWTNHEENRTLRLNVTNDAACEVVSNELRRTPL